jgi:hypothetical protein
MSYFGRPLLVLLACCTWLVLGEARADVARFALVIGNNRPDSAEDQVLEYADDDALTLHQMFMQAGMHSVLFARPDETSRTLHPGVTPHEPPRREALLARAAELFAEMERAKSRGHRVEFYLFFSGHGGVAAAEGHIVLEDAPLGRDDLCELLRRSPADYNHVFIDACCSFFMAFAQKKGEGRESREPYRGPFPIERLPGELGNTGFVLSTASERDSHEWTRYRGGILSHELRSALRGAADVNTDGHISYLELERFLEVVNAGIDNPNFRPDITVHAPGNDRGLDVLEWGDPAAAALSVVGGDIRHFFVEDHNGVRVLDAHPERGQTVNLWLPETRPMFVRASDEPYDFPVTSRERLTIDRLLSVEPELRRKGGGALAFALRGLFTLPFGSASFQGLGVPRAPERTPPVWPRIATASVAIGAAGAGLALSTAAWAAYRDRGEGTQLEQGARHRDYRNYNLWSIPCYALAAAAGVAWGWLEHRPNLWLSPNAGGGASATTSSPAATFWGIDVGGRF